MNDNFIDVTINKEVSNQDKYMKLASSSIVEDKKGKKTFVDGIFAKAFMLINDVVYSNGAFYTPQGMESQDKILKDISESIYDYFPTNLSANSKKSFEALKFLSVEDKFDFADKMQIPLNNGELYINENKNWEFILDKFEPVPYRLPVNFVPLKNKKPTPYFDKWLNDLFVKEDILTLQEYLGYCLLPTTKGQKALIIIGNGGEGKSILADILNALFGNSFSAPQDMMKFLDERFMLPELENQLLVYDDDLSEKMLETSGTFKKLVTNKMSITADRKGSQPFRFQPFARFIMLSNSMLEAKYDSTDAFFRRLLPLQVKPKDPSREDIPELGDLIAQEKEGILQWALIGLKRLLDNNYQFTTSERSDMILGDYQQIANHLPEFMEDCFEVDYLKNEDFTTKEMYDVYKVWANQKEYPVKSQRTVSKWISNEHERYRLQRSNNIYRNGNRSRGYIGGNFIKSNIKTTIKIKI